MAYAPAEPALRWLGSRSFLTACVALLGVIVALGIVKARQYARGDPGRVPTIGFEGPLEIMPGEKLAYRVHLHDHRTGRPISSERVRLTLAVDDSERTLGEARTDPSGQALVDASIPPDLGRGFIQLIASVPGDEDRAIASRVLSIRRGGDSFVSTDKPIYQPGQTIHIRTLSFGSTQRPHSNAKVELEILDPLGTKIHRASQKTSEFGITHLDFKLVDEVKLGEYRIVLHAGSGMAERTIEVKRYVLPKLKLSLDVARTHVEPGKKLDGTLRANWMFGKPVENAAVEIRLDGQRINGKTSAAGTFPFSLKTGRSSGSRMLEATLEVEGGLRAETKRSIRIGGGLVVWAIPEGGNFVRGVENALWVVTTDESGAPRPARVRVLPNGPEAQTSERGVAKLAVKPDPNEDAFDVEAIAAGAPRATRRVANAPTDLLIRPESIVLRPGAPLRFRVLADPKWDGEILVGVTKNRRFLRTARAELKSGGAEVSFEMPPKARGLIRLEALRFTAGGTIAQGQRQLFVESPSIDLDARTNGPVHAPGGVAVVEFDVRAPGADSNRAALALSAVDEAVFTAIDTNVDQESSFFGTRRELGRSERSWIGLFEKRPAEILDSRDPALGESKEILLSALSSLAPSERAEEPNADSVAEQLVVSKKRLGAYFILLPLAIGALALVALFGWGLSRTLGATPIEGASESDRAEWMSAVRRFSIAWLLGPIVASSILLVVILLVPREAWYPVAWLVPGILLFAAQVVFAARVRRAALGEAFPGFRRMLVVALVASFAIVAGIGVALFDQNRWLATAIRPFLFAIFVSILIVLWQLAFGVFTAARRIDRSGIRPLILGALIAGLPLGLVAIGWAVRADLKHKPSLLVLVAREQASVAQGEMGNPKPIASNLRYAVQGPADNQSDEPVRVRDYFPETLLWQPELVTDDAGHARIEIPLAHSITDWRLAISAVVPDGRVGGLTVPIRVLQDFFVDVAPPAALTEGDEASIPVTVFNYLDRSEDVIVDLECEGLERLGPREQKLKLGPRETRGIGFRVRAVKPGEHKVTVHLRGGKVSDAVERTLRISPDGALKTRAWNGSLVGTSNLEIEIPANAVAANTELSVKVYGGLFSQLAESLDGVLQMPHGCFEQASSTTYPNVLVLQYLNRTRGLTSPVEKKAQGYIAEGYQRLLSFEVAGGGFDWFGHGPANTLLTAYGLVEFSDMSKVFPIDDGLITRTRAFLYAQQAGDGSWQAPSHGVHSALETRSGDRVLTTAYVAWALAESSDRDPRLQKALDFVARASGPEADEPYALALRANALIAGNRRDDARPLLTKLVGLAKKSDTGVSFVSERAGVTFSRGNALTVELTALVAHALAQLSLEPELRKNALAYIVAEREASGAWASTAATVAAMRALLDDAKRLDIDDQTVRITVNDKPADKVVVSRGARDVHHLVGVSRMAEPGNNRIRLEATGAGDLAYQVVAKYYVPWSKLTGEKTGNLALDVRYRPASARVGQTVECNVELRWRDKTPLPMPIVEVGLPPGFDVEVADLAKLVAEGKIARYSIASDRITFYMPSASAAAPTRLAYRLRALHPVRALAPRSLAYAYYEPNVRVEVPPVRLVAN